MSKRTIYIALFAWIVLATILLVWVFGGGEAQAQVPSCDGTCQSALLEEWASTSHQAKQMDSWQAIGWNALFLLSHGMTGVGIAVGILALFWFVPGLQRFALHALDEFKIVLGKVKRGEPISMEDAMIAVACALSTGIRLLAVSVIIGASVIVAALLTRMGG